MVNVSFPVHKKDVTKTVEHSHLAPGVPRSSWDGWFAIAIFPKHSAIRWLKAHLFHRACGRGRHPLAAIEGLGTRSEILITWATDKKVKVFQKEVHIETLGVSYLPLRITHEGCFLLEGTPPRYTMVFTIPEEKVQARFHFETCWPIWWSRWGRMLSYVGQHSETKVILAHKGAEKELEGFGVMEHVCGISMPFDFTRRLPLHFHWDVLAFHTPGAPFDSAAGLSIGRKGKTIIQLRAAAKLPGRSAQAMQGLSVHYLEGLRSEDGDGRAFMVPVRWEGSLGNRYGTFQYEAHSSTPVATIIPGGGMLGFSFEGEWRSRGAGVETWKGSGFAEYGDFSGKLITLAKLRKQ